MSDIREASFGRATADGTIVTTTELVAATSEPVAVPRVGMRALILGWAQVDSGAATTAITPRIRQGTAIGDTLVSEAIAEETTAAEAATWFASAVVELADLDAVQFVMTVQQTDATGNGTVNNATILVFLF